VQPLATQLPTDLTEGQVRKPRAKHRTKREHGLAQACLTAD
jgi:hypothetical protein